MRQIECLERKIGPVGQEVGQLLDRGRAKFDRARSNFAYGLAGVIVDFFDHTSEHFVRIEGLENIRPISGPSLVVANHPGKAEIFRSGQVAYLIVSGDTSRIAYIVSDEYRNLFRFPSYAIATWIFERLAVKMIQVRQAYRDRKAVLIPEDIGNPLDIPTIPAEESPPKIELIKKMIRSLSAHFDQNVSEIITPEGHRSDGLKPGEAGVGLIVDRLYRYLKEKNIDTDNSYVLPVGIRIEAYEPKKEFAMEIGLPISPGAVIGKAIQLGLKMEEIAEEARKKGMTPLNFVYEDTGGQILYRELIELTDKPLADSAKTEKGQETPENLVLQIRQNKKKPWYNPMIAHTVMFAVRSLLPQEQWGVYNPESLFFFLTLCGNVKLGTDKNTGRVGLVYTRGDFDK